MASVGLGTGLLLFFGAPLLTRLLLGPGFEESIVVLRVLALLPPVVALSSAFGTQWMLALHLDAELNRIVLAAGLLNVVLSLALGSWWHHIGVAASVVVAEVFVTGATYLALSRRSLNPWSAVAEPEGEMAA